MALGAGSYPEPPPEKPRLCCGRCHECVADAQALINISRKRLCNSASPETREAWKLVKAEVEKTEPELAKCMVRECVYRGYCPEMFPCSYADTELFEKDLEAYRGAI